MAVLDANENIKKGRTQCAPTGIFLFLCKLEGVRSTSGWSRAPTGSVYMMASILILIHTLNSLENSNFLQLTTPASNKIF